MRFIGSLGTNPTIISPDTKSDKRWNRWRVILRNSILIPWLTRNSPVAEFDPRGRERFKIRDCAAHKTFMGVLLVVYLIHIFNNRYSIRPTSVRRNKTLAVYFSLMPWIPVFRLVEQFDTMCSTLLRYWHIGSFQSRLFNCWGPDK